MEYKIPDKEACMIMWKVVYQEIMGEKLTIAPLLDESGMQVRGTDRAKLSHGQRSFQWDSTHK
eukprot:scaffold236225_cov84-Attheya_sp.AAC.2